MKPPFIQCLFLLLPFGLFAQTQTIRGTIMDQESRSTIIGASVVLLNSDPLVGTTSDVDGKFKLTKVKVGRVDLKVTYLGYAPKNPFGRE